MITTAPIIVDEFQSIAMQLTAIVNNVAAAGGEPVGVVVSSVLPDKILESVVQRLSGELERACHNLNLQISGGNTVISKAVNKPILNITVIGKTEGYTTNLCGVIGVICRLKNKRNEKKW